MELFFTFESSIGHGSKSRKWGERKAAKSARLPYTVALALVAEQGGRWCQAGDGGGEAKRGPGGRNRSSVWPSVLLQAPQGQSKAELCPSLAGAQGSIPSLMFRGAGPRATFSRRREESARNSQPSGPRALIFCPGGRGCLRYPVCLLPSLGPEWAYGQMLPSTRVPPRDGQVDRVPAPVGCAASRRDHTSLGFNPPRLLVQPHQCPAPRWERFSFGIVLECSWLDLVRPRWPPCLWSATASFSMSGPAHSLAHH